MSLDGFAIVNVRESTPQTMVVTTALGGTIIVYIIPFLLKCHFQYMTVCELINYLYLVKLIHVDILSC